MTPCILLNFLYGLKSQMSRIDKRKRQEEETFLEWERHSGSVTRPPQRTAFPIAFPDKMSDKMWNTVGDATDSLSIGRPPRKAEPAVHATKIVQGAVPLGGFASSTPDLAKYRT